MNKQLITLIIMLLLSNASIAASIIQCTQPDGTIEFTNRGCSKSNAYNSRTTYRPNSSQSLVRKKTNRKRAPFKQAAFVRLQKKLIMAETSEEMEQQAEIITEKIRSYSQKGKLKKAYDMVAATYVKLSKHLKKEHWEGRQINTDIVRIRSVFEDILITQSTISSANELDLAIETAWQRHRINY